MTTLDTPATPAQLYAAGNPEYDAAFVAHTIATLTAGLRAVVGYCSTCGAVGTERCRDGGRFVARHDVRGAA